MKEKKYIETDPILDNKENYLKKELYSLIKEDSSIFEFLQEAAIDGLWFWDLDNPENEWMNSRFWRTLGYDPTKMPHKSSAWQDIIFKEDLKKVYANFSKHSQDPTYPFDQIVRYRHKLGHTVWIQCRGIILRDDQGTPRKMLGAHTDITKLKKAEKDLRNQISDFEHIIEGTDLGTWRWNVQTGETIFNERWAQIIGYSLSELSPVSIDTWMKYSHPDDLEKSNKLLQEHFSGNTAIYDCEARMKHKNGEYIWVLDKGKVISWDDQGNPEWMIGSHQEITKKKKDFERNRLFIEQTPSAMAMFDCEMNYLAASKKWFEVYGIKDNNILGKSHFQVLPEIANKWKSNYQKSLEGEVIRNEEESIEKKDGTIQWISWELCPWYSNENQVGGIVIHTSDITKLKRKEELKSLLKVAEDQNKRLKNFAHIVSHNLKSHSGNFEMLLDLFIQENPAMKNNEIVQLFKTASTNLSETISHLNEVVLINTLIDESLVSIGLKDVIDLIAKSVHAIAIESKVIIKNEVDADIKVLAIPAYLDSILLNFITNGIKYSADERDSYISLSAIKEKQEVVLSIKDNGLGIDLKKHRSKLFGMYKTFHPNIKKSRGIGLFITKNQVEAIGGRIEVESKVNSGTTFKIFMKYE
ncbi:PAS domain-containing protein [Aquimarina sp. 2201CG14-23]|uniref:PAS domain-containing protein n=1 Tax=Aquimarina mycalae TaxID=3040073 RepID=UPI002477E07A|nr:PAS domain-containing protein [Aquimarina sp. 2201CG14-23]MDH7445209.1 PAS domain-containing protein [Aquimarina sp. 2201CG14-23]